MNSSNNSLSSPEDRCFYPVYRRPIIHDEYVISDYLFLVLAVIINLLTCPLVVLLNALVITAITTKRRLQTTQNILLACLAVTDLVVGIGAQPAFITQKIILLVYDGSSSLSCKLDNVIQLAILCLCLLSLLHLVVISVERFVAMKNPFRYEEIVTKFRLIVAVVCSWFLIAMIFVARMLRFKAFSPFIITHVGFPVIVFCHINVYFICRRHEIQIQSEQVSQEATEKFLKEKKAWKTTSIIIGGVFVCYFPGFVIRIVPELFPEFLVERLCVSSRPLFVSFYMLNSLCNPIIYCWRSKEIREASKQLLKKSVNRVPN